MSQPTTSTIALQLWAGASVLNLGYQGEVMDWGWPDPAHNFLTRGGLFWQIFYDHKPLTWQLQTVTPRFSDERVLSAHYLFHSAEQPDWRLELSYEFVAVHDGGTLLESSWHLHSTSGALDGNRVELVTRQRVDFSADNQKDSALILPRQQAALHYYDKQFLLISAADDNKLVGWACQDPRDHDGQGAAPDSQGQLSGNAVATGRVESALAIAPHADGPQLRWQVNYRTLDHYPRLPEFPQKLRVQSTPSAWPLLDQGVGRVSELLKLTETEQKKLRGIAQQSFYLCRHSMLPWGSHIAAFDETSYKDNTGSDGYSYFWPRDGALTLLALHPYLSSTERQRLGQKYMQQLQNSWDVLGYLGHRYQPGPDAQLGSSWYPATIPGLPQQLDQTALSILALGKYGQYGEIWQKLVAFLLEQIGDNGWHLPCYDLWENDWGQFVSTQASVVAALASANYALTQQKVSAHVPQSTRQAIHSQYQASLNALQKQLATGETIRGWRTDLEKGDYQLQADERADAAWHWLWQLQVYAPAQPQLQKVLQEISRKLQQPSGGFQRYTNDYYLRGTGDSPVWYLATLWQARWYLTQGDYAQAARAVRFVLEHAEPTGILPEAADPVTGFALSVRPLYWAQAEVLNLLDYVM